jgi:hypothetical protein
MFSRSESKQLRQEFWVAFGKSFPRKWILYNTKIKGLSFKFHFELKRAMVSLDIEPRSLEKRIELWDKIIALRSIITSEYFPNAVFSEALVLENEKEISRVFVLLPNVSIHDKRTWAEAMRFLNDTMMIMEGFYEEFRDILET